MITPVFGIIGIDKFYDARGGIKPNFWTLHPAIKTDIKYLGRRKPMDTNKNKRHTQGDNMLNKIIKIVGIGTIIGLKGVNTWGDYEIWDGQGPMPTENVLIEYDSKGGIKKVIIFKDDPYAPKYVCVEDETDPHYGFIGLRLNFPEELIQDCEAMIWRIQDETWIQELEEIVSSEENFHAWCDKQEFFDNSGRNFFFSAKTYAYILKKVNEKNYLVSGDFCKRVGLSLVLRSIHQKGYTYCMSGLDGDTPVGGYLINLRAVIEYDF